MAKSAYRNTNFRQETLEMIHSMQEIIEEYDGQKLTARQVYYQFVSRDLIPNSDKSYKRLTGVLADARYAGLVDWDSIEDRGREPDMPAEWSSIDNLVMIAIKQFRLPRWKDQKNYVELWVEKQALAGVLEPIARKWHVPLMVNKGYCVDPSTRVLTSDLRWVRADAIRKGMHLVGVDEKVPGHKKQRRMRRATVTRVCGFTSPRLRINTDHGPIVVSTNHPLLVTRLNGKGEWNRGWYWVNAEDLHEGDRIARLCSPWEEKTSYDAGWLAGLYDGEGCLTLATRIGALFATVYQMEGPVLDKARALLREYGFYSSETKGKTSGVVGLKTYGIDRIIELLGTIRPLRLIDNFQKLLDRGTGPAKSKTPAVVKSITKMKPGIVIGIETDTKTLITEGFVSHNSSASAMKAAAERMIESCEIQPIIDDYLDDQDTETCVSRLGEATRPVVLYLGDHDPSGEDMVRDIADRLSEFHVLSVQVKKLALTMKQIKQFNPPPNPAKITDSRARGYIEKYGSSSWELDALPPRELNRIVEAGIGELIDLAKFNDVIAEEKKQRDRLNKAMQSIAKKGK